MSKLETVNITNFAANEAHGAYSTIGGTYRHTLPDGSTVERRAEAHSVATDKLLAASLKLLKPHLDAVIEKSAANLREYLDALDVAKKGAIDAHRTLEREQRRLFAAASGVAVNQTLDGHAAMAPDGTPIEVRTV